MNIKFVSNRSHLIVMIYRHCHIQIADRSYHDDILLLDQ